MKKKENPIRKPLLIFIIICLVTTNIFYFYIMKKQSEQIKEYGKLLNMVKDIERMQENDKIGGVHKQGYVCIDMNERKHWEVLETCSHEYLHYKYWGGHFE